MTTTITRQLLRIATAGSVDDGKSTLIGRLLHDTDSLPIDHLEAVTDEEGVADLAALSDGLRAEREQGITIDVAYRFFSTDPQLHPRRHPGTRALHAQHVHRRLQRPRRDPAGRREHRRAASDPPARQNRKAAWCSEPSWPRSTRSIWSTSTKRVRRGAGGTAGIGTPARARRRTVIPIAAKAGDNVVTPLGEHRLVRRADPSRVPRRRRTAMRPQPHIEELRLPVQWVSRPDRRDRRRYTGRLSAGTLSVGDEVVVLPSGTEGTVTAWTPSTTTAVLPLHHCRFRSNWPTTSTSAAATFCVSGGAQAPFAGSGPRTRSHGLLVRRTPRCAPATG